VGKRVPGTLFNDAGHHFLGSKRNVCGKGPIATETEVA